MKENIYEVILIEDYYHNHNHYYAPTSTSFVPLLFAPFEQPAAGHPVLSACDSNRTAAIPPDACTIPFSQQRVEEVLIPSPSAYYRPFHRSCCSIFNCLIQRYAARYAALILPLNLYPLLF
ncbi:hypothetical protein X798_02776 [Onchocerca flexuosa]|uniref:Uncharacterized protein n=1 Tax=Onchocerca flexuosa TaxID=387005 RepID=A0A238BZ44_9BILA|nr:hypothetical protein X798_02776 [Onchocerca flexuosa]